MKATIEAFTGAFRGLSESEIGKDGVPKMKPLNAALTNAGFEKITAAERDAFMAQSGKADPLGSAVEVRLIASDTNPFTMRVNGALVLSMRIGETATIPATMLAAAERDCGATFQTEE